MSNETEGDFVYLDHLSREELVAQLVQAKKDLAFLEKDHRDTLALYQESRKKEESAKYEKEAMEKTFLDIAQVVGELSAEKRVIESSALDIAQAVGELSAERNKAVGEKAALENTAMEIAAAVGELSTERNKAVGEKAVLENTAMEIAAAVGELSSERNRIQKEKDLIERSALDTIRDLSELKSLQRAEKEKARAGVLPAAYLDAVPSLDGESPEVLKTGFLRAVAQIQSLKAEYRSLLANQVPSFLLPSLEAGQPLVPAGEATLLVVTMGDFYQHLVTINAVRVARFLKKLSADVHRIAELFDGHVVSLHAHQFTILFGTSEETRNHVIEAALAALEILKLSGTSGFRLSARLHCGPLVLGDLGRTGKVSFGVIGEMLAWLEAMKKTELAHPGALLVTEAAFARLRCFFEGRKLEPVALKGRGNLGLVLLSRRLPLLANPYRLDPQGRFAARYMPLAAEIEKKRDAFFPGWSFEKVESRDGSLGTGEAIAFFAVAFARDLRLEIDEDLLIKASFLVHLGKLSIPKAVLNNPSIGASDRKLVKGMLSATLAILQKNPAFRDVAELLADSRNEIDKTKRAETRMLKIASAFEGVSFPKLYKTSVLNLKQAENTFRNSFPHPLYKQFADLYGS